MPAKLLFSDPQEAANRHQSMHEQEQPSMTLKNWWLNTPTPSLRKRTAGLWPRPGPRGQAAVHRDGGAGDTKRRAALSYSI